VAGRPGFAAGVHQRGGHAASARRNRLCLSGREVRTWPYGGGSSGPRRTMADHDSHADDLLVEPCAPVPARLGLVEPSRTRVQDRAYRWARHLERRRDVGSGCSSETAILRMRATWRSLSFGLRHPCDHVQKRLRVRACFVRCSSLVRIPRWPRGCGT
jgi:hypothetical protein